MSAGHTAPDPQADPVRFGADDRPAADPAGRLLLAPGAEAALIRLDLPRGLKGPAREQVAWRYLRDQMGLGPEQVEMRPWSADKGAAAEWDRVLLVDAARMALWRAGGERASAILPDYLALPAAQDLWVISGTDIGISARLGLRDGLSCETELAPALLARALEDALAADAAPKAVLCVGATPGWLSDLLQPHDIPVAADMAALAAHGIVAPERLAHGELLADLRSDPRAARDRLRRRVLPWRWPALAAMLAAAIWAGDRMIELRALDQGTDALRAEITQITRDRFVPAGPILDIRAQVSRALAAAQAEAQNADRSVSPLVLLGQASDVIRAQGAEPDLIAFTALDGLEIELRLADFAAVDQLVAALANAGIDTDLRDARTTSGAGGEDAGGVRVALRLTPMQGELQDG